MCRECESVEKKSLSQAMSRKTMKNISGSKGLKKIKIHKFVQLFAA